MAEFLLMILESFVRIFASKRESQTDRPAAFNPGAEEAKAEEG
ncbi:MAG TPA: hypothetical protein VF789_11390 [Thermoanaerobaculia bacterium]